ncbi:MAG: serine/threonine protein kinase [Proteobacteria bacterium]|nr:serine/threonine protein kinase [Pseudomonadota bacterium]
MGVVYKGVRDFDGLDKQEFVACKVIRADLASDIVYQELFVREAFTAMGLAHSHLVKVHDCVRSHDTIYLFMELIDGVSLDTLVRYHGPLPEHLVANIIYRAAQVLAYLHEAGICHRDVAPPNILISKAGHIKVSDFGLARASHESNSSHHGFKGRLPFACPRMYGPYWSRPTTLPVAICRLVPRPAKTPMPIRSCHASSRERSHCPIVHSPRSFASSSVIYKSWTRRGGDFELRSCWLTICLPTFRFRQS